MSFSFDSPYHKIMHMRRIYLACAALVIAFTTLVFASKSNAQQADAIRAYIDNEWLPANLPIIQAGQEDYLRQYGEYWQGLATHDTKPDYDSTDPRPADQQTVPADKLAAKPTDKLDRPTWSELFPNVITKLPAALRIDVYSGPKGQGFVIHLDYCVDGVCYSKAVNGGPETERDQDWFKFVEESEVLR